MVLLVQCIHVLWVGSLAVPLFHDGTNDNPKFYHLASVILIHFRQSSTFISVTVSSISYISLSKDTTMVPPQ